MGRGEEKPGLMGNRWMTLVLVVVVLILAAVLIYVFTHQEILEKFKKKRPPLKPGVSPATGQRLQSPGDQPELGLADSRLAVVASVWATCRVAPTWQRSAAHRLPV